MGKKFEKFLLLMWKNFLLQRRHPWQTIIEMFSPVVFCSLLVFVRSLVEPEVHVGQFYRPFKIEMPVLVNFTGIAKIAYSPNSPPLEKIMSDTVKAISDDEKHTLQHIAFENSTEMENYFTTADGGHTILACVMFEDSLANLPDLPPYLKVVFRFPGELRRGAWVSKSERTQYAWNTNLLFPLYQIAGPRGWDMNNGAEPGYLFEGYLKLQQELSFAIINHFKQVVHKTSFSRTSTSILMQRFPYPDWIWDKLMKILRQYVGLIIMLSFVYTCVSTVKVITTEKEKQLKEAMKIMGLPNWLHWTAWFIKTFLVLFISAILMVILMKANWYPGSNVSVFTHSNPVIIFIFLILFVCATITFCFAISVFFSKASTAATCAGMAWFLAYMPYSFILEQYTETNLTKKLFASLFSNSAMSFGFQLMIMYEGIGEGVQWHNIWKSTTPDDTLKMGHLIIILIFDTFLYLLIALYAEAVFPGDYGIPRPWNFIFDKSFWRDQPHQPVALEQEESKKSEFFERDPIFLEPIIQIQQLGKVYPDGKEAVRNLSLNMYEGQITALLGHNGAGKTSTMFMLTGMVPPSSGTAIMNGYDIRTDMAEIRGSLGLCPQHNILFDDLTVKEHLYFFSRLKGLNKQEANEEARKYIEILDLIPKADQQSETLSGGMKRKLSVGIALCAGSAIVLFDEPTAGMDPAARRGLWNIMQSQKEGRTIILTTHFMDEADLLGDRIAILAGGQLQCCGSSFFLKKKYGIGYLLVMDKSPNCDVQQVTKLLQNHIPDIQVKSNIGSELTYAMGEKQAAVFKNMLKDLETNSAKLGVLSYGISLTTLEEVFMRVGDDEDQKETKNATETAVLVGDSNSPNRDVGKNLLTGCPLWLNQFRSMMMKRRLSIFRSWVLLAIHHFLPVCILALSIMVARGWGDWNSSRNPDLEIKLDGYDDPVTVLTYDGDNKYMNRYIEILEENNNRLINWGTEHLGDRIYKEAKSNLIDVRLRYISGVTFFQNNSILAWFNNEPYHSPPLSLQLVINAILQKEVSPLYTIHMHNYPLPFTTKTQFTKMIEGQFLSYQIAFNLGFSMVFVSSFYILFYVRERVVKAKHLQFVSGVDVIAFWVPPFLWDLVTFVSITLCVIITLIVFQEDGFKTPEELGRMFVIFMIFGFCTLPMVYLVSYLYDIPSTGYIRLALFNIFTGIAGFLIVHILTSLEIDRKDEADALHWVFLIIPIYSLMRAIMDVNRLRATHELCDMFLEQCPLGVPEGYCKQQICSDHPECCTTTKNYYDWEAPGIGRNCFYTLTMGVMFIVMLLLIEYRMTDKLQQKIFKYTKRYSPPPPIEHEDSDVKEEKEKVRKASETEINNYTILLRDITKYYGKFLAVNGLCLGINRYECFGLLGANGAGKTSTFKMMTGDTKCSSGEAWVNGLSLKTDMKKIQQLIGYCPQFDALLDDLTCRETLIIFCLLRGVTYSDSKFVAIKLARDFDFYKHIDKKIRKLSGGNKRKLSTALTLIGDPIILYLDEPTAGMDPRTRRFLWNELCKVRDNGTCIVLTSHSMEECEALCTRLAIMVNGSFMCLGSTQHLKSKFSQGYTLTIKIRKQRQSVAVLHSEVELIEGFVKKNFPKAIIREKYQELITFYIADRTVPWSTMFGVMEQGKQSLNIEDYSLGQSSLEQVFLSFTKYQREEYFEEE